jgi:hypothetical protein
MEIAAVLNAHSQPDIIIDTVDSILTYMTKNVLVLIDGYGWDKMKDVPLPCHRMEGFPHGTIRPYRNVALGLKSVVETWPNADWYYYCEYDVLIGSNRFLHNLKKAEEIGVWMLGNDGHVDDLAMPLVQALIGQPIKSSYYLIGCSQFFHRKFIDKLNEIDFFERFLNMTNGFTNGYFPFYSGYDISEHMYPTLCRHFGGNIGVFATYDEHGKWHGAYEYFPVRWKPDLNPEKDKYKEASIMHPLKSYDHPIRKYHREKREKWKDLQNQEK